VARHHLVVVPSQFLSKDYVDGLEPHFFDPAFAMACNTNKIYFEHVLRMLHHHHQEKDLSKCTLVDICGTDNPSIVNNIPRETFEAQVDAMKRKLGLFRSGPSESELARRAERDAARDERQAARDERQAARAKWDEDVARIKARHLAERRAEQDAARPKREAEKRMRQDMSPEQRKAPRRRPNHPRVTNSSSHVLHVPSQEEVGKRRKKTIQARNAALEPGMAASMEPWTSPEWRKLLDAVEAHGKKAWQRVADDVGSRTAAQCESQYAFLKRVKRLEPISEDTPLREGIFKGFGKPAFNKFDKCVAKIDGKRITTVGQLAKLPVDNIGPNLSYLKELTGLTDNTAFKKALAWKAMAVEAIEFWQ